MVLKLFSAFITELFVLLLLCCLQGVQADSSAAHIKHYDKQHGKNIIANQSNHFSNKKQKRKSSSLKATNGDESALWSNAFNFSKSWGTQVDPRTGVFSAWIKTGSLVSNLGHGPNIDLEVSYNSNSMAETDGLGQGWSWNLTHFSPVTNELSTSHGQNFYLQPISKGHWWPRYHKLKDIQIDGDKKTHFVITYPNGLREVLDHDGYEIRLEQQDGRGVNFSYLPGQHLLSSITDDLGNRIVITHNTSYMTVTSHNSDGSLVNIRISHSNGKLYSVYLPADNGWDKKSIDINYDSNHPNQISRITYPTGLTKKIQYNCTNAMKMSLSADSPIRGLCVVAKEVVDPGAGQQETATNYAYDYAQANEHNYLAFNSGLTLLQDAKQDILFDAPVGYIYQTTTNNGLITQVRTYDKYHLLIDTKIIRQRDNHLLSEEQSFYCNTDQSDGCSHTSFDNLPVTYSLPLKTVTKIWGDAFSSPAVTTVSTNYDDHGRITMTKDAYGRIKQIEYCSGESEIKGCPAEPAGWSLSSVVKKIIQFPSGPKPPSHTTSNYYIKLPNINGKGYILVLATQAIVSDTDWAKIFMDYAYYQDPKDTLNYGLLRETIRTQGKSPDSKATRVIKRYNYEVNTWHTARTTRISVLSDSDKPIALPSETVSLFTNQIIEHTDAEGKNITHYNYDMMGRIRRIDLAVGTPFAVSKEYQYTVSPTLNQIIITDGTGLQRKVVFDGAGRIIKKFDEAISLQEKTEPGRWRLKQSVTYDAYGHVATQSNYMHWTHYLTPTCISEDFVTKILTTSFHYDEVGRLIRTDLPDGQWVIKQYDDSNRCIVSYKQSGDHYSTVSVVRGNVLDKPVQEVTLPAPVDALPSVNQLCVNASHEPGAAVSTITYDNYGRPLSVTDPMGRIMTTVYDVQGRIDDVMSPNGDTIHYNYDINNNVIEKWAAPVNLHKSYLLASSHYDTAGRLLWQAGEDGKKTSYTYTPDGQIAKEMTPNGHVISWNYNVLGLPVSKSVDGKSILQVDYDHIKALPVKKTDITGITSYSYTNDGKVQHMVRIGKNGYPNYYLLWKYDPDRRVISAPDVANGQRLIMYDALGRTDQVFYLMPNGHLQLLYANVYDEFSRIKKIYSGARPHHLTDTVRTIAYDAMGRQSDVTDLHVRGYIPMKVSESRYYYDADNNITQINQTNEGNKSAVLQYQYDKRNNMVSMSCSGSTGLPLCPRDTAFKDSGLKQPPVIISQHYTFNALNRITQVEEKLQDLVKNQTVSKTMAYGYGDTNAPLRFQWVLTKWNNNTSMVNYLTYDNVGNMITDGEGNHMTYNSFNQVTTVNKPTGEQSNYAYDGSGRKARESTSAGDVSYLFYINKGLIGEQTGEADAKHTISYLGNAKAVDGVITEFYQKNYKGDITAVMSNISGAKPDKEYYEYLYKLKQHNVYSPYGMVWHCNDTSSLPLYQQTLLGFDGERTDPATGWQFLGAGHRVYSPTQRYFLSEDPVGDGYAFGSNNPIMNTDPSGNMPKWMGEVAYILSAVGSYGLSLVHKKWAHITSTAISMATFTVAMGLIDPVGALLVAGPASTIPVISAAIPTNKGLSITSKVIGTMQTAAVLALAGIMILDATGDFGLAPTTGVPLGQFFLSKPVNVELNDFAAVKLSSMDSLKNTIPEDMLGLNNMFSRKLVVRPWTEDKVTRLWGSLSSMENGIGKVMNQDMATLIGGAKSSLGEIYLDQLDELINLKMRFLNGNSAAGSEYETLFGKIIRSFGPGKSYPNGINIEELLGNTGMGGVVSVGNGNQETTMFLRMESRSNWNTDGQHLWGMYRVKGGEIEYVKGNYEDLGLSEFFNDEGKLIVHRVTLAHEFTWV